ncbi:MAG TPA: helix-turn-helix transcriptional regulator [Accumulibacter sp.]|nr:helix-turn-helix transcriptional regulator [Accumulibacter sp.]
MSTISERLKEERKRLGLSQGEFAGLLAIHRNTQARYERGEREPDTAYLSGLAKAGVDVGYVLTGDRGDDQRGLIQGYVHVISFLQGYLGLGKGALDAEFEEAVKASCEGTKRFLENPDKSLEESERADTKLRVVMRKSPVFLYLSDLEELLERVEFVQEAKALRISAREKARAILELYREEKETGEKSGFRRVEQALARGNC